MSRLQSFFPRAYRLRPLGPRAGDHIAQLRIKGPEATKNLLLPYSIGLGYFVIPAAGGGLVIEAEDFRVEPLDAATSFWVRARLFLLFKKKKYLRFEDFSVFSYGPKRGAQALHHLQPAYVQHRGFARRRPHRRAP